MEKPIENFIFNDIVLYCKGWYQSPDGDTIIDDLGYLFGEIYAWTPKTEEEVAHFMMRVLDKLFEEQGQIFRSESYMNSFSGFHEQIKRTMMLYNCSFDMAVIWVVHSILQGLTVDHIKLNRPVYGKKKHFRMGGFFKKYPISMTYKEMNNRAIKMFGD